MTTSIRRWAPRVGLALAGAFTAVVLAASKFEKQMASVSTMLTETTMPAMRGFEKGIKSLAVEFGQSTATLSKGLYDILSASISAGNAMGVLETSSRAAIAGMTETAEAVDVITTVINSYQLSASEANRVSDALFATVKAGKLTFADLARFLGMVAAPAAASGASMEELFAAIATLTRAGVRPRIAMTGMRQAFMAFAKSTPDAIKAAEAFGLSLSTNTLKTIGLTGVLEKLKGATTEQVAAMFSSVEAYNAVITLLGDTEGMARDLASQMTASGSTMEAFNKMANTMSFWLGRLKWQFIVLAMDIGKMFLPALKDISKYILENQNHIKSFVLNTLAIWWNKTLDTIATIEHAFDNWGDTVELVMDTASFHIRMFVEDAKHQLTVDLVDAFDQAGRNIERGLARKLPSVLQRMAGLIALQAGHVREAMEEFGVQGVIPVFKPDSKTAKAYGKMIERQQKEVQALKEIDLGLYERAEATKVTTTKRRLSEEEKAEKNSIAARWAEWNKGLDKRKRTYDKYRARMVSEEELAWRKLFDTVRGIWDNLLAMFTGNEEKKRDEIAKTKAAQGDAGFVGLEEMWKRVQLAALDMPAKAPGVTTGAPGQIQQKQLTVLGQIKRTGAEAVGWLQKILEKPSSSSALQ